MAKDRKASSAMPTTVGGLETIRFRWQGTPGVPLLMHNTRLADVTDPFASEMRKITGDKKRKGTTEGQLALMRMEFFGGLYTLQSLKPATVRDECIPVIPADTIQGAFEDAARMLRRKKDAERAIEVLEPARLIYEGPRTPEKLFEDESFRDRRFVRIGKVRVMRCRPRFEGWQAEVEVLFDPSQMDRATVIDLAQRIGGQCGIMDRRPKCGRFKVISAE